MTWPLADLKCTIISCDESVVYTSNTIRTIHAFVLASRRYIKGKGTH